MKNITCSFAGFIYLSLSLLARTAIHDVLQVSRCAILLVAHCIESRLISVYRSSTGALYCDTLVAEKNPNRKQTVQILCLARSQQSRSSRLAPKKQPPGRWKPDKLRLDIAGEEVRRVVPIGITYKVVFFMHAHEPSSNGSFTYVHAYYFTNSTHTRRQQHRYIRLIRTDHGKMPRGKGLPTHIILVSYFGWCR